MQETFEYIAAGVIVGQNVLNIYFAKKLGDMEPLLEFWESLWGGIKDYTNLLIKTKGFQTSPAI